MTRTDRLRSRFWRLIVTWPCTSRWMPDCALAKMSLSSGTISDSGWPMTSASRRSIELFGRAVEDADAALAVDADHAGAGAGQHRLGKSPPLVDDVARAHDVVALRAQLVGHPVEGLAELGEIALRAPHRHLDVEIAGRHDVGGADQAADRRDQPVGEVRARATPPTAARSARSPCTSARRQAARRTAAPADWRNR